MKRIVILSLGLVIFLALIFKPIALITGAREEYSEGRILIEYEIYGCGSLVVRVIQGGEDMANLLKAEYPEVATNEVCFTENSDEPYLHLDSAEFWTGGLAKGYQYIIEGEVVGATKGALKCCAEDEDDVAYNDIVPQFRVDNWYTANYMPYYKFGNPILMLLFIAGILICSVSIIIEVVKRRSK